MYKKLLQSLLVIILSGIVFTSCKKEKQNVIPTTQQLLAGKWVITYFATDYNKNKVLDEQEKEPADAAEQMTIYFNPNGTGYTGNYYYYDSSFETENFTWNLVDENKGIQIIHDYGYGNDTTNVTIHQLGLSDCILQDNEDYGYGYNYTEWIIMQKQ